MSSQVALDPTVFLQYGAVGLIAAIALYAVRVLYHRETKEHEREKERADRLEEELAKLNATVRDSYVVALNDALKAVAEATARLRRER